MAKILNFVPKQRKAAPASVKQRRPGAAIIIFPGVRYDRKAAAKSGDTGDHDGPQDTPRRRKI